MPNHFHLVLKVKDKIELKKETGTSLEKDPVSLKRPGPLGVK